MMNRIFQEIRGNIIKKKSFHFTGDQLVFEDFNPNQRINSADNMLNTVTQDRHFYPKNSLSHMKEKLSRGEITYFVTPVEKGYLLFWRNPQDDICSRHFDIILNNTTLQNERGPLYKNWEIFKAVSFKNSADYVL